MNEKPKFMTHDRIMAGEEYVSYSDYLMLQRERDEAREEIEFLKKTPLKQRCQQLEREIDHWCDMHTIASKQRDEEREQNAYLRCIAERAIHYLDQSYRDGFSNKASELRYKLKQLKEGAK